MRRNEPSKIQELQRCRGMGASAMQQSAANGELSTRNKSAYSSRSAIAIEMPLGRDGGDLGAEMPTKFGGDRISGWRAMGVRVSECRRVCRECAGTKMNVC